MLIFKLTLMFFLSISPPFLETIFMPTVTQGLHNFLMARRKSHNGPDLLARWNPNMETQVNVAADGGEPVEGKRNTFTDGELEWFSFRIPKNAGTTPEFCDWKLRCPLDLHTEGIGCTGFDYVNLCSRWFGFDFDSIIGHAPGTGISDEDMEAVKKAAWAIPWLEIRKSSGGGGLHIYALCCDDGIPTANHTEHAALGRAILEKMAIIANFNFSKKVDICGGNMWFYHRKMTEENEGFKLLKPATARLSLADIPGDWRTHLAVVQGKRATQRVIGVPNTADDEFDQLISCRRHVPFDDEHRRIIDALGQEGFSVIYQQDNHLVQAHTARLAQLIADPANKIKGVFKTLSKGDNPGKPNCFWFPLSNGGLQVHSLLARNEGRSHLGPVGLLDHLQVQRAGHAGRCCGCL